jgi:hypothetical protein
LDDGANAGQQLVRYELLNAVNPIECRRGRAVAVWLTGLLVLCAQPGRATTIEREQTTQPAQAAEAAVLEAAPQVDLSVLERFLQVSPTRASERKANQSSLTRAQVVNLYNTLYLSASGVAMGWTGVAAPTCAPGSVNASYRQATLDRFNFFRQVAGLPSISFFAETDLPGAGAQASALIQGSNPGLSHTPTTTAVCYSANGATAAGKSNLAKGAAGAGAITLYVDDPGSSNTFVGHRRWILYPPLAKSFSGDVGGTGVSTASDLWVIQNGNDGTWGPRAAMPNGVAWPPGGFVPYQALPAQSNRWSFSWPGANMTNAVASVTKNGEAIAVLGYDTRDNAGYGDASIVFRPNNVAASGPFVSYASPGTTDQSYQVTISGMTGTNVPTSVSYTVTVIDPAQSPNASISGAAQLAAGGSVVDGTTLCANPPTGVSCSAVSGGAFSCAVPSGWSGTLHLQAGNTKRVAAKRFAVGVTGAQTNQNFVVLDANALACNLDIDNNGLNEAAIDGVMMLRKLFGIVGIEQVTTASSVCAQRTSANDALAYLAAQNYDFDGGGVAAHREGLVLLRLMLGVSGNDAVAGTSLSWPTIQTKINTACGTSF